MTVHRIVRRHWCGFALALASAIVSTGCGSGSDSTVEADSASNSAEPGPDTSKGEEAASKNACDMVSDDVAAEVLGVAIVRREPHGKPGDRSVSCIKGLKRTSNPKDFTYVNASMIVGGASAADEAAGQPGSKSVAGLGDRATFLSNAGALFVVDGDDLIEVQLVKGGVPGDQQDCVTLAKDVLSHLG